MSFSCCWGKTETLLQILFCVLRRLGSADWYQILHCSWLVSYKRWRYLFYTNNGWCNNVTMILQHCSHHLETFFINCKPLYSPPWVCFIHSGQEAQCMIADQILCLVTLTKLSPVCTNILNTSMETCHVPAYFKVSTIIPVPKKPRTTGLNDYRPVGLTSVVKSFEHLVFSHLKSLTNPLLELLQFAYRANRSVDNAVSMALHYTLQQLDSPGTYARILFVDFCSAFNTILPALLQDKLS